MAESPAEGTFYAFGDSLHQGDGEPLQPKFTHALPFPGTHPHGVVLRVGVYTDVATFDPGIEPAVTETTRITAPAFTAPG